MIHWVNERIFPAEIKELMSVVNLPKSLQDEFKKAMKEVTDEGAVTYTTKAKVEYYFSIYKDEIIKLLGELNNLEDCY